MNVAKDEKITLLEKQYADLLAKYEKEINELKHLLEDGNSNSSQQIERLKQQHKKLVDDLNETFALSSKNYEKQIFDLQMKIEQLQN